MLYIGTSGWSYIHWGKGIFYPKKPNLFYYSKFFNSVEINYSFYHIPKTTTLEKWKKQTPEKFLFSIKVNRIITHLKRLKNSKIIFRKFFKICNVLEENLGPLLFQFPPSFKMNEEILKDFLTFLRKNYKKEKFVMEFRHHSWFKTKIYKILKKFNIALCLANSPYYPEVEKQTADFFYIRFHGSKNLFSSSYTKKELIYYAKIIKKHLKKGPVFVYFNNDAKGFAVKNASELKKILKNDIII